MHSIQVKKLVASLALIAASSIAWAQYVWTDERGAKQFSDQPPPASVPKSRILKQPGSLTSPAATAGAASATEAAAPAAAGAATKAPLSIAERNADFMKRRAEQAEKDKKAADEAQAASEKSKNCEKTRRYQDVLASGQRIATTDQRGERVFLSDEQRNREMQDANRILADCK